ncbi:hypothetical protein NKI63_29685 [Mesorhizobium sp. M0410]|uniref:hypothetical protein n=1 Tax=Mesorhizobium sp. M0410 TaxID=2956943 RepID=UPI00333A428A
MAEIIADDSHVGNGAKRMILLRRITAARQKSSIWIEQIRAPPPAFAFGLLRYDLGRIISRRDCSVRMDIGSIRGHSGGVTIVDWD